MSNEQIILVVDDDQAVLISIQDILEQQVGFKVIGAYDFPSAESILMSTHVNVLVADVLLPGSRQENGITLSQEAVERWPTIALILISADPPEEFHSHPRRAVCLQKPFGRDALLAAVDEAQARARDAGK